MQHSVYILLHYDHQNFSTAKHAFIEVQAENGQLLNKLAEFAKKKLCKNLNLPKKEVHIHSYQVYDELPLIIREEPNNLAGNVAPTIHARWQAVCDQKNPNDIPRYRCSHCGDYVQAGDDRNFCPSCGTQMNG